MFRNSSNISQKQRESSLLQDPDLGSYAKTIAALEFKTKRSDEENAALSLVETFLEEPNRLDLQDRDQLKLFLRYLANEKLRDYAARIVFLEFLPERTEAQSRELALLKDPDTAPFAARIAYLEELNQNDELSWRESFEYSVLIDPIARRNLDAALCYFDKTLITPVDIRKSRLWNDKHVYDTFDTIAELEFKDKLSIEEKKLLEKLYLKHVADIYWHTKEEVINTDCKSISYNPISNCEVNDYQGYTIDLELPVLRTIEDEVNKSADKLTNFYLTQIVCQANPNNKQSNYNPNSVFAEKLNENIKRSGADDSVFHTIKLAILRYFFELSPAKDKVARYFPFDRLQRLTDYLYNEMTNQNMALDTSDFYKTYLQIQKSFDKYERNNAFAYTEDAIVKRIQQQNKLFNYKPANPETKPDLSYAQDPIVQRMKNSY